MRKVLKPITNRTWKPFVQWYLRRTRTFTYEDLAVEIPPGVFHPGFFFSTKQLLRYLGSIDLDGKDFLEIGCGSGIVSIFAAKKNARVTCVDISANAVRATKENAQRNGSGVDAFSSDLFTAVPPHRFDLVAANPPYYRRRPSTPEEHAWYAGENLEYFRRFFQQATTYTHPGSRIVMVLSDECDLGAIRDLAAEAGWEWEISHTTKNFFETGYIVSLYSSKK